MSEDISEDNRLNKDCNGDFSIDDAISHLSGLGADSRYTSYIESYISGLERTNTSYERQIEMKDEEIDELKNALLKSKENEQRDGLTGAFDHATFKKDLKDSLTRAMLYDCPFTMALIDIDHFKEVNDRYGHPAGDAVLKQIFNFLYDNLRNQDLIYRYGGEEIALRLPQCDESRAAVITERLRKGIESQTFTYQTPGGRSENVDLTVSIGYATFTPGSRMDTEEIISRADKSLYDSKERGRNKTSKWQSNGESVHVGNYPDEDKPTSELVEDLIDKKVAHTGADPLTGLYDDRYLEHFISETVPSRTDRGWKTSLGLIDLVKFEEYRRRYGGPQGDEALKTVAHHINSYRKSDLSLTRIARMRDKDGGFKDYFAVVFEAVGKDTLFTKMASLKKDLESLEIEKRTDSDDDGYIHLTIDTVFSTYESGQKNSDGSDITARQMIDSTNSTLDDKSLRNGKPRQVRL